MKINQQDVFLISFRICPFVVRSQIVAEEKGITLSTTYIDLDNKPDWFLKMSPTQTVPALTIGDKVIFESSIICDFIDAITLESLYPDDLVAKYHNKSWIEFVSTIIFQQYSFMLSKDEDKYTDNLQQFESSLKKIEAIFPSSPYFNGEPFSIIEAAFAPVAFRMELTKSLVGHDSFVELPKIRMWATNILKRNSVKKYLDRKFEEEFVDHLVSNDAIMVSRSFPSMKNILSL